jgi:hypothetical protein
MNRIRRPCHDDDIVKNSDCLKISMYRADDGDVTAYFELQGSIELTGEKLDGPLAPKLSMAFVKDMLERFEKTKE